jgi:hypothetical protein
VKYFRYESVVLVAVVLVGVMQLSAATPAAGPTVKPSKPSGPVIVPRIYSSVRALLATVPRELTKGPGSELASSQCMAVNEWLAKNVPVGSMLVVSGKFAGYSGTPATGATLAFRSDWTTIHGKKLGLLAIADMDGKSIPKLAMFSSGKRYKYADINRRRTIREKRGAASSVTVHGRIASLLVTSGQLRLRVRGGGLGAIRSSQYRVAKPKPKSKAKPKPKPTSKPTPRATSKPAKAPASKDSNSKKADRKFKLAKTYHSFGKKDKAVAILKEIVAEYPGTPAAKSAVAKLKELDK